MRDEEKKMRGLIARLKKFENAKRPHGQKLQDMADLAYATGGKSPTGYYWWLATGHVPNLKVLLLDKFLTQKGY